jgi:hypothetical protein
MLQDDSSTASLGFLGFPVWWSALVIGVILCDLTLRQIRRRRHPQPH